MIQKLHYQLDDYLIYLEFKSRDSMLDRKSFQKVYMKLDIHSNVFINLESFYRKLSIDTDDCSLGELFEAFSEVKQELFSLEILTNYLVIS